LARSTAARPSASTAGGRRTGQPTGTPTSRTIVRTRSAALVDTSTMRTDSARAWARTVSAMLAARAAARSATVAALAHALALLSAVSARTSAAAVWHRLRRMVCQPPNARLPANASATPAIAYGWIIG